MGNRAANQPKQPETEQEMKEPMPLFTTPQTVFATRLALVQLDWLPAGVCVTESDKFVSCDSRGGSISEYHRHNCGTRELVKDSSLEVWDIAYSQGEIYVTDSSTATVRVYSGSDGSPTRSIKLGLQGQKEMAIAISGNSLYVASRRTKVVLRIKLDHGDDQDVETFADELQGPWFVSATSDHVAVCCVGNHTVNVYSMSGQLLYRYGRGKSGLDVDDLSTPMGILLDPAHEGRVYVADYNNHRVSVVGVGGRTIGHINLRKDRLSHPRGLSWDRGGNLCIACGGHDTASTIIVYKLAVKEDHVT